MRRTYVYRAILCLFLVGETGCGSSLEDGVAGLIGHLDQCAREKAHVNALKMVRGSLYTYAGPWQTADVTLPDLQNWIRSVNVLCGVEVLGLLGLPA